MSKQDIKENIPIIYLKSIIRGIILSIVLLLITAVVFHYSNLDPKHIDTVTFIITVLSIVYAALYGCFKIKTKGYLHGGIIGILYMVVVGMVSLFVQKGNIHFKGLVIMLIMSLVIGIFSGLIGIILADR
ncbi:MAG: family rane protein [Caloramator sp.]|jgi:putative membrane protein (TIGR04086 family)|uniref:TIGR04086 family membrane protein n=1 Tax=Caloramator sp. TaxID=1871330 RepID=UPI001DF457B9|nr:TIGR04086 family membrane protein [Caloramator sp.]MBZ4662503.1 family rane protein [Caloramator sp.]